MVKFVTNAEYKMRKVCNLYDSLESISEQHIIHPVKLYVRCQNTKQLLRRYKESPVKKKQLQEKKYAKKRIENIQVIKEKTLHIIK
jgi:hypothetical protein